MATLKAIVDHRKDDGTYSVKIRITHRRESRCIPTSLYATDRHLTRSKKIKDPDIIRATNVFMDKIRSILAKIEGLEALPCARVKDIVKTRLDDGDSFYLDFYEYAESKISKMKNHTAVAYKSAFNRLKSFRSRLDINDVTYSFIMSFRSYLSEAGIANNGINIYLSKIKHIFNLAREEFNNDDIIKVRTTPFKKGVIPSVEATEHRVISAEQVRRIASMSLTKNDNFARDMFLLSFCLIGINVVDLYNLKKSNLKDGILTYNRQKTKGKRKDKALISVRVEPEAAEIMDRYASDRSDDYLFMFHRRYASYDVMRTCVNLYIKRLRDYDKTLPADLHYYYARHTWATIAHNDCGIDKMDVHDALNHVDNQMRITDIYIKKDFTRIWEANRKVLDYVFGSDEK